MNKKLTVSALLVLPAFAHMVHAFGESVGKDYRNYVHPTFTSMALAHVSGAHINGIATINIDAGKKLAMISLASDSGFTSDDGISMLKLALLKAINLGCDEVIASGFGEDAKIYFAQGEFGPIGDSESKSISFSELPKPSIRTIGIYAAAGYASGAIALGSIIGKTFYDSLEFFARGGYAPAYAFATIDAGKRAA